MSTLNVKTTFSIHEIEAGMWNQLSDGKPFQSHQWYVFGEQAMSDCLPIYLLAYDGEALIARASLWLIRNEPVPKALGRIRGAAAQIFKRWPLLICRSPLSYTTGLILADDERRADILSAFVKAALVAARQQGASFIIFDYLNKAGTSDWPGHFSAIPDLDPGTNMENHWLSMDEYLAAGHKKDRQHYKRVLREAEKLGIKIDCHPSAENIEAALPLIRNVERDHGALPNPWARQMLEHMQMVNSSFLTATIDHQLVGCGLIFEDNHSQMTSVLGLAKNVPYVYFMLLYESLKMAFEHQVRLLRWGSGAYEVKQRLGFSSEDNGSLVFTAVNPYLQKALQRLS
ncbi:MAG TPA: GNAT family N-acetyltransferase [Anaerolineales bacterium]|nr:GNAT family N-acetyltransferase [Anaerolineales bacterium]HLO34414.1 GNAT family N-acetyltransferase [Anaerolineales bacterium]